MIYIATPLYENKVYVPFLHGFINTVYEFTKQGIPVEYSFQTGTMLAMNRENLARSFLKTSCQYLLYIDADIAFSAKDIFTLLASQVDVVSGIYRLRTPVPKGHHKIPIRLVGGQWLDLINDKKEDSVDELLECEEVPGGLLMIRRQVIEKMYDRIPYIFNQSFTRSTLGQAISIEEDFVGEDVHFCNVWRDMGGKIYVNTNVRVGHIGEFQYEP